MSSGSSLSRLTLKGDSIIPTQPQFCALFQLGQHGDDPSRTTIIEWNTNLRTTGFALKKKPTGGPRSAWTLENIDRVCAAVKIKPHSKHAVALIMSDRSIRGISQF